MQTLFVRFYCICFKLIEFILYRNFKLTKLNNLTGELKYN
jgi:hypothetical protein